MPLPAVVCVQRDLASDPQAALEWPGKQQTEREIDRFTGIGAEQTTRVPRVMIGLILTRSARVVRPKADQHSHDGDPATVGRTRRSTDRPASGLSGRVHRSSPVYTRPSAAAPGCLCGTENQMKAESRFDDLGDLPALQGGEVIQEVGCKGAQRGQPGPVASGCGPPGART